MCNTGKTKQMKNNNNTNKNKNNKYYIHSWKTGTLRIQCQKTPSSYMVWCNEIRFSNEEKKCPFPVLIVFLVSLVRPIIVCVFTFDRISLASYACWCSFPAFPLFLWRKIEINREHHHHVNRNVNSSYLRCEYQEHPGSSKVLCWKSNK